MILLACSFYTGTSCTCTSFDRKLIMTEDIFVFAAAELNFETDDINLWAMAIQQPGGSPTDRVLTRYSHANPTIKDLFYKLKSLCNVRAMNTLKGLGNHDIVNSYKLVMECSCSCLDLLFHLPVPDELFKDLSGTESRIVAGPVVEEDDTTGMPALFGWTCLFTTDNDNDPLTFPK